MPNQYLTFETIVGKRGRSWKWSVCTTDGEVLIKGSENSLPAAKYKSNRALFLLLLSAPYYLSLPNLELGRSAGAKFKRR
jgi:hypothetical protein